MPSVLVEILRLVDTHQPGWVECSLVDAQGTRHFFVENIPYVTEQDLWLESAYPTNSSIDCEVLEAWKDKDGRSLLRVDTSRPWGVESKSGVTEFIVTSCQVAGT
jgi:hypothetical protein